MKTNKNHGLTKPQDILVLSGIGNGEKHCLRSFTDHHKASSWSMQHFFHLRINPFPVGLVKVLRRWSTAASQNALSCVWNGFNGMCKMWYHYVPVSFPPFLGLASSILKHASNLQSIFIFYDLWKNLENDEAIQSRLAEPDGFISKAVITITNLHTSPDPHSIVPLRISPPWHLIHCLLRTRSCLNQVSYSIHVGNAMMLRNANWIE